MNPISSNPKIHIPTIDTVHQVEKAKIKALALELPGKATVKKEQSLKPTSFNENFAELVKPINFEKKAPFSKVAPFIFLSKSGPSLVKTLKRTMETTAFEQKEIKAIIKQAKEISKKKTI